MKALQRLESTRLAAGSKWVGLTMMFVFAAGIAAPALAVGPPPAPANDECANATPISVPGTVSGSTTDATTDSAVPVCGTTLSTAPGIWYSFTAASSGTVTADTCTSRNFDTKIGVFSGSCAAPVCVAGNDDAFGDCGFGSRVTFPVTAGTTYKVLMTGFSTAKGDFQLDLKTTSKTLEQNLACARDGINALMPPEIMGPAQKSLMVNLLNNAERYAATPYRNLSLFSVNSVLARVDGCDLRGTPDTVITQGGAGMDFVNSCPSQAPINQCLKDAQSQLSGP